MTKTVVGWLSAFAALVALPYSEVARSQCVIFDKPEELFARADAVFLGTVVRAEATGIKGSHAIVTIATFRVDRTWKGDVAKELRVGADTSFQADKEYLVFAGGKPLTTSILCQWAEPSDRAKAKLDWLSKNEPRPAKTELEGSWEAIYSVTAGSQPFKLKPGLVTLHVEGDTLMALHLLPVGREGPVNTPVPLAFALDTKATPKRIDYWQTPDKKIEAAYDLKGDELHLAVPESGEACGSSPPRPKAVSGAAGTCAVLLVLKKR